MRTANSVTRTLVGASFTILFIAAMVVPSQADFLTIKGTSSTDDVSIFKEDSDAHYGLFALDYVGAYASGVGVRRTLLRFDVSALAGQFTEITSITLNLFPHSLDDPGNTNTGTLEVYQIAPANVGWVEGPTQGGTAQTGEATWDNLAHPSSPWAGSAGLNIPGTDYVNTLLASATYNNTTTFNDFNSPLGGGLSFGGGNAALTALVTTWLSGGNAGLLLRATDEATADDRLIRLNSADSLAPASLHPELVIEFIPEPSTVLLILGGAMLIWRAKRVNR